MHKSLDKFLVCQYFASLYGKNPDSLKPKLFKVSFWTANIKNSTPHIAELILEICVAEYDWFRLAVKSYKLYLIPTISFAI